MDMNRNNGFRETSKRTIEKEYIEKVHLTQSAACISVVKRKVNLVGPRFEECHRVKTDLIKNAFQSSGDSHANGFGGSKRHRFANDRFPS